LVVLYSFGLVAPHPQGEGQRWFFTPIEKQKRPVYTVLQYHPYRAGIKPKINQYGGKGAVFAEI